MPCSTPEVARLQISLPAPAWPERRTTAKKARGGMAVLVVVMRAYPLQIVASEPCYVDVTCNNVSLYLYGTLAGAIRVALLDPRKLRQIAELELAERDVPRRELRSTMQAHVL